jgi:hypothetical protein
VDARSGWDGGGGATTWMGVRRRWFLFCGLGRVGGGRRTTGADSRGDAGRQSHGRAEKVGTSFYPHFVLFSSRECTSKFWPVDSNTIQMRINRI